MRSRFILALFLVLVTTPLRAQTYTVTDLGVTGTDVTSEASAINASGQVVGSTYPQSNAFEGHAALFQASGNVPLGFLGGTQSFARAINASGTIVGSGTLASASTRAIRFSGNGTGNTNLGTLTGGSNSVAYGINASGQVVGYAVNADGNGRATRFGATPAQNIDLGTPGNNDSSAAAINDSGTIVGSEQLGNGYARATRFADTGNIDLGTLGGDSSEAYAINASGVIVGRAELPGSFPHATRFSGTGTNNVDLGLLPGGQVSRALGINSAGDIVGEGDVVVGNTTSFHGFIHRNGEMKDLNDLIPAGAGVVITSAAGINDQGQIAASGRFTNGSRRALRLDPAGATPTPTPSPSPGPAATSYLITAKAKPKNKGTVKGGGTYAAGASVKLRAKPKAGYAFLGWKEGSKIVSKKKAYRFTVTSARVLSASFR